MNRTIKFRGVEFFSKKFVYGQTIRETEDGFDMWTGDDWLHCTDLAQLVGFDANGNEVYEDDELVNAANETFNAILLDGIYTDEGFIHTVPLEYCKLKEARS